MAFFIFILYIALGSFHSSYAASPPDNARLLDSLQSVLGELDRQIESGRGEESVMLNSLNARQQESALQEELIRYYQTRMADTQDSLQSLEGTIPALELQLDRLNGEIGNLDTRLQPMSAALAKVMLAERRLNGWAILDFLLRADSWHELLERRTVITRLRQSETRQHALLSSEIGSLRENQSQLTARTQELLRARREFEHLQSVYKHTNDALQNEQSSLNQSQAALRRQIDGIRNNRRLLEMQRQQGERALDAIRDMVRSATLGTPITGTPLNLIKGKLPWPIKGRVVERFGKSRNAELETVTDNPGIELSCKAGETVHSVASGRVSSVTWLRGFGNVCIVEHPGAFYTVYAKLGEVSVKPNDVVTDGSVIGYPSLDPLNNDYRFHFELWDRREKQDPLTWLENR